MFVLLMAVILTGCTTQLTDEKGKGVQYTEKNVCEACNKKCETKYKEEDKEEIKENETKEDNNKVDENQENKTEEITLSKEEKINVCKEECTKAKGNRRIQFNKKLWLTKKEVKNHLLKKPKQDKI